MTEQTFTESDFEEQVERFDQAWLEDLPPSIDDFLPHNDASTVAGFGRRDLLFELIMIDLECRWRRQPTSVASTVDILASSEEPKRAGIPEKPLLEDYVIQHQDAISLADLPIELVAQEYRVRSRWGDKPDHETYVGRFSQLAHALPSSLREVDRQQRGVPSPNGPLPAHYQSVTVRCPHCQNPTSLDENQSASDIKCPTCGSVFGLIDDTNAATKAHQETKTIGRFTLVECVGSGGFGTVWRAKDSELDRFVAIKIPHKNRWGTTDGALFLREARAAAQLNHPNIVSVHEIGRDDDAIFIVSDFVQGVSLADRLEDGFFTPKEAATVCRSLANALEQAHDLGVIHRDLKPGNVLLDGDDQPYLTDFGLAKRDHEVTMTLDGRVLGTPAYMSPEQAEGMAHDADGRSDIYSLGVILFEMMTGERPFRGNTQMVIHKVINTEAPSPCSFNAHIPKDLETICLKCLEKKPGNRYQSAHELSAELTRYLNGEPILARPPGRIERFFRWYPKHAVQVSMLYGLAMSFIWTFAIVAGVLASIEYPDPTGCFAPFWLAITVPALFVHTLMVKFPNAIWFWIGRYFDVAAIVAALLESDPQWLVFMFIIGTSGTVLSVGAAYYRIKFRKTD